MKKKHTYESLPLDEFGVAHYSPREDETWAFLVKRQKELVQTRACKEYLKGVEYLNFGDQIPQHFEITDILMQKTKW